MYFYAESHADCAVMSSSRLAVSGFVRKGQRFVSLSHANGERKEEEETLELGQNEQRAESKQECV